jgi:cation:H+ antiporter
MIEILFLIVGIALLIKGADFLVDGSSSLAKKYGIPSLVIGLTIVAFGTSLPELVVNILAAIKGSGEIAFGNIIGSNIANILLILGISAIVMNIRAEHSTIWKEIPFSILGAIILYIFAKIFWIDGIELNKLYRFEAIILLLFFIIFLYYIYEMMRNKKNVNEPNLTKEINEEIHKHSNLKISLMIIGGLIALYFGGEWTVKGAVFIAQKFGLSEYLISATIIAVGTSLPELVTSIIAALKKESDIAIGNIVGSNIFNIFFILGITGLISPIAIPSFIATDILILIVISIIFFLFFFVGKRQELKRWQGICFILMYISYIVFLIFRG